MVFLLSGSDGTLPLLEAVKLENIDLVSILLDAGAKVDDINTLGESAIQLARDIRNADLLNLLAKQKAKNDSINSTLDEASVQILTEHIEKEAKLDLVLSKLQGAIQVYLVVLLIFL